MAERVATWMARRPLTFASLFYGLGMLPLALLLRALWFDEALYAGDLGAPSPAGLVAALGGTAAVLVATPWLMRFEWARRIGELMQRVLGPLSLPGAVWLGLVSGLAEEMLFRGALQPMIGLVPASIAFALAHLVGGWWLFALIVGLALGALYAWDGSLWPCVLAHALLNAVNLYRLSRRSSIRSGYQ